MQNSTVPKFIVQGTYSPFDLDNKTTISLTLQSDSLIPAKDKYILIVMDRSASMTGPKLEACIKGVSQVINTLFDHNPNPKVDLITFNQKPTFYSLQTKSREECLEILSGIKTEGVTCYYPVFEMIDNIINNKAIWDFNLSKITRKDKAYFAKNRIPQAKIDELAMLLISSGEGEPIELTKRKTNEFKTLIQSKIPLVEFYTLALGTPESAEKLEGIMAGLSGSFQYLQKSDEIVARIEDISEYLVEKRLSSFVKFQEKRIRQKKIDFISKKSKIKDWNIKSYWEAAFSLNTSLKDFEMFKDTFKLCIKLEKEEHEITLDVPLVFEKSE